MQIKEISIKNFKSIRKLQMTNIEKAFIIVGKNSTGKTVILDAILAVSGIYQIKPSDFIVSDGNIRIDISYVVTKEDLKSFHDRGLISKYKRYDSWYNDFCKKVPSFQPLEEEDSFRLFVSFTANKGGIVRYGDGISKHNPHLIKILPKIHYIDHKRNIEGIQRDILLAQGQDAIVSLRDNVCMFDSAKKCVNCFQCIGIIEKKKPEELSIFEVAKLLEYKLYHRNLDSFVEKVNDCFRRNNERAQSIRYDMNFNIDEIFQMNTVVLNHERNTVGPLSTMSEGTKSIYILSLLEAYIAEQNSIPSIIMMEDPEAYLHPQLQKSASEILYRLSKKNQVIFSTHSPNLLFTFNSRQIKQVILDENYDTTVKEDTDIDEILNDLGYSANDLMNVSFVFIVEGKQDSSRLPLLLNKYYSEIFDENGLPKRVAIIATNSCTNIKTYANLKYINKLYLKDQFMMIRDGDGLNPKELKAQLCNYYRSRGREDIDILPRVRERNVLILKYYSFENYFLEPSIMSAIGVVESEDAFYQTLFEKYKEYLYRLSSVKNMTEKTGCKIKTKDDLKLNFELIKIYVRGHNLFDIYYGRYKGDALTEILRRYIELAPRETFADILDAIDQFLFFESKVTSAKITEGEEKDNSNKLNN
ncbi:ATP-dependent nuclease [Lachnoclostridium phytofermentans]|uniref:ATP-dependent endonuclease of the OLD family-like protein n=1 Tax=Lachnoclostridium phytofermentans (strain ATCC 700394 / DSM 18823 / ISDg) TaxID=357809 RepID=A9KJX6_LACP7|nr:AAA family ATPase [Lachnoclostridium phytofermentans]ABX41131.1 ATP-dependent endonuclease of the OLD family-like protein [Lachnoclostridium phytofermentans ISDg]